MKLTYTVTNQSQHKTLRQVLKNEFHISSRLLTILKHNKQILLNDTFTFLDSPVSTGDVIKVNLDIIEDNSNIVPLHIKLDIIYEDDSLLIVNKPSNMAIHPSCLHYETTLSNAVKAYFDSINLHRKIRPITRLDKDTSGIVVFAKNQYIQECLVKQMETNIFKKKYIAILDGILENSSGIINAPIARKNNSIIERCINPNGDISISHYKVLAKNTFTLVEFRLETGRTHQLRVHSKYLGYPILGDSLYGNSSKLIDRQALHCYTIEFIHPINKKKMQFTAPIPNDMENIINEYIYKPGSV